MKREQAFSTVNWRRYLDVNTNPRAKKFLESRGDDVLWQIASNIHQSATIKKTKQLVLMIHPNAGAVIRIDESEYTEVLNLCLTWFESRENYSVCSKIQKFSENISKLKKSSKSKKRLSKII